MGRKGWTGPPKSELEHEVCVRCGKSFVKGHVSPSQVFRSAIAIDAIVSVTQQWEKHKNSCKKDKFQCVPCGKFYASDNVSGCLVNILQTQLTQRLRQVESLVPPANLRCSSRSRREGPEELQVCSLRQGLPVVWPPLRAHGNSTQAEGRLMALQPLWMRPMLLKKTGCTKACHQEACEIAVPLTCFYKRLMQKRTGDLQRLRVFQPGEIDEDASAHPREERLALRTRTSLLVRLQGTLPTS